MPKTNVNLTVNTIDETLKLRGGVYYFEYPENCTLIWNQFNFQFDNVMGDYQISSANDEIHLLRLWSSMKIFEYIISSWLDCVDSENLLLSNPLSFFIILNNNNNIIIFHSVQKQKAWVPGIGTCVYLTKYINKILNSLFTY